MQIHRYLIIPSLLWTSLALAQAHAFLDHSDPRVGAMVMGPPPVVKIWFTEELEPAFSRIQVFDAAGHEVDQKDSKVDPANAALMTVSLPKLPLGNYKVVWHAVATDTHHTQGTFPFMVMAP
jgi:methionine-rich copper-binding protein CopC